MVSINQAQNLEKFFKQIGKHHDIKGGFKLSSKAMLVERKNQN